MLSSDSPGTLSLTLAKITKLLSFLVTLQALSLFLAKVTKPLTQPNHKSSHTTQLQHTLTCSSGVVTCFPRLPLLPGTLSTTYKEKSITQQWATGISTLQ